MKKTIYRFLFIFLFVTISFKASCQNNTVIGKWLICHSQGLQVGFDYAWYKNSIGNYNLGNTEIFLGYSYNNKVLNTIDLNISLHCGAKIRNHYDHRFDFNSKIRYLRKSSEDFLYEVFEIDKFDRVFAHNKYFIELPITFGYTFIQKIELLMGYSFRYYIPQESNDEYDFIFDNKFENGILSGLSIKLSDKFLINGSYFFAPKNCYSRLMIINDKEYLSTLKSRTFQINIQYNFH